MGQLRQCPLDIALATVAARLAGASVASCVLVLRAVRHQMAERMWTSDGTTPEEYLQRTSLRPMLASLLERICKDRPDRLLPFMLEYLQKTYPDASLSANPSNAPGSFGTWARRTDVQPTEADLQAYLTEIKARETLEAVLEQALRVQPANVVAFVIDSLCSGEELLGAPTGDQCVVVRAFFHRALCGTC